MEKALESIAKALTDDKLEKKELNEYISYLVNSIPVPSLHRSVFFPLYFYERYKYGCGSYNFII